MPTAPGVPDAVPDAVRREPSVTHASNVVKTTRRAACTPVTGIAALAVFATIGAASPPARAVDGCLVLLCMAAPSWRAIAQCVPPVRQVLRDLARGKPFPTCAMAGAGNSATHRWAAAPAFCPPQYVDVRESDSGPSHHCHFSGAISVHVDGALWARTWWSAGGDSVTEFAPAAKAQSSGRDTQFDDDLATWRAVNPPAAAPAPSRDC